MNSSHWHQEIVVNKPTEELTPSSNITSSSKGNNNLNTNGGGAEKKGAGTVVRPPKEQPIPCPRCNSINTKFCYYNNYSLTQPRYFCKGCRRYWTEGGSLRNIPVGGGSRKHKRSPSSSGVASLPEVAVKKLFVHPSLQSPSNYNNNTMIQQHHERAGHDLNLSFPNHHQDYSCMSDFVHHHMPNTSSQTTTVAPTGSSSHLSAVDQLRTGMTSRGSNMGLGLGGSGFSGNNSTFMPIISDPAADSVYSSASFSNFMHDFKAPSLNFSLDNALEIGRSGSGGGDFIGTNHNSVQNEPISSSMGGASNRGRVLGSLFDIDVKNNQQVDDDNDHNNNYHDDQHHQHQTGQSGGHGVSTTGYWTGMLGGGSGSDW